MTYDYCKACLARADKCLVPDSHRAQGRIVWCADFLLGGTHGKRIRKQFKPGITKKEVEKYEHLMIADFERGLLLPGDKSKTLFNQVFDKYVDEHLAVSTWGYEGIKYYVAPLKDLLGHFPIGALTLQILTDKRQEFQRANSLSNSSVNRIFTMVKACLNKAIEWGYLQRNPAQFLKALYVKETIVRFLSIEEIARLRANIHDRRLEVYVSVLLHTGIRPINIKGMRWPQVDMANRVVQVTTYKGRKPHTYPVPIDEEVFPLFKERYEATKGQGLVFDTACVDELATQAIKDSGINEGRTKEEYFTIYGLKHCYASHLLMNGATLFDVAKLLGHTDTRMIVRHYGHLSLEHLRGVQAKINLTPRAVELKVI